MELVAPGLWRWAAQHPEWSPKFTWPEEVSCFLVEADGATLVLDPLVPDDAGFWDVLDDATGERDLPVAVLLTQAAHARSAGEVARRYGAGVWGHRDARAKVSGAMFREIAGGDVVPGGASVLELDQEPGGSGTPLYLPSHRAIAVGDVFLSVEGELRVWWGYEHDSREWYEQRLLPSLRRWLELPVERLLVAHGEQVTGGVEALAAALERPPYELE